MVQLVFRIILVFRYIHYSPALCKALSIEHGFNFYSKMQHYNKSVCLIPQKLIFTVSPIKYKTVRQVRKLWWFKEKYVLVDCERSCTLGHNLRHTLDTWVSRRECHCVQLVSSLCNASPNLSMSHGWSTVQQSRTLYLSYRFYSVQQYWGLWRKQTTKTMFILVTV